MNAQQIDATEQSYRESVETLARLQSSKQISNGAPLHAAIIFETFFRHAGQAVRIFCRNLSANVFENDWLLDAAKAALARGVGISVVTQDEPEHSAFSSWLSSNAAHPGITFVPNIRQAKGSPRLGCNFAVMDGRAFRFEPDESAIQAVACMNDPIMSTRLESLFARLVR